MLCFIFAIIGIIYVLVIKKKIKLPFKLPFIKSDGSDDKKVEAAKPIDDKDAEESKDEEGKKEGDVNASG